MMQTQLPIVTGPHWIVAWKPFTLILIAFTIQQISVSVGFPGPAADLMTAIALGIAGLGIYESITAALWLARTRYTLTRTGIARTIAVIRKRPESEVDYSHIINVEALETPLGQLLGYGHIRVDTRDGGYFRLEAVDDFSQFFSMLEHQRKLHSPSTMRSNLNDSNPE
jgi:hypothetical protein